MRLVTFAEGGHTRIGALVMWGGRSRVLDFSRAMPGLPTTMLEFLAAGEAAWMLAKRAVTSPDERHLLAEAAVTLLAPLPRPGKIIGVGHNYQDHSGGELPQYPTFFAKYANVVIGPGQPIVIPRVSSQVDYEGELAVVIGKRARYVSEAQALAVVAGYTLFNDVTARDYQRRSNQWTLGKSFDTFGPMGPALVTSDEIPDPGNLELSLTLNGREMQHSNTRHLIFSIPFLVSYLSEVMTLEPGDLISTGTPSGTGASQKPPVFLQPGDELCLRVERVGELRTPVVAES